jgi:hypothetical protein
MAQYRILSLDGGGIRGLVSAILVQSLDTQFSILKNVDLFAGTSAGGIIALALAAGVPIADVVSLYENKGSEIFQSLDFTECLFSAKRSAAANFSLDPSELYQAMYSSDGLKSELEAIVGSTATLGTIPKKALVTTLQLRSSLPNNAWQPLAITNLSGSANPSVDNATTLVDAAMCSSAAPLYFPPHQHPVYGYCADGGVVANNPAVVAIASAIASGVLLKDIVMLSVGTGFAPSSMNVTGNPDCYGINQWAWPESSGSQPAFAIISALFDGSSNVNDFECKMLLGSAYIRSNPTITANIGLDDYQAVQTLILDTTNYMKSATSNWQSVVSFAKANF